MTIQEARRQADKAGNLATKQLRQAAMNLVKATGYANLAGQPNRASKLRKWADELIAMRCSTAPDSIFDAVRMERD